jgi:hypothetical protein
MVDNKAGTKKKAKPDCVQGDVFDVLKGIRKGDCIFELNEKIEELVGAIREHSKGGELTLKLKIAPLNAGDPHSLKVTDEIKIKKPEKVNGISVFYSTSRNTLQKNDPNQMDFSDVDDSFEDKE